MKVDRANADYDEHEPDQVDASRHVPAKVAEQADHDRRYDEEQGVGNLERAREREMPSVLSPAESEKPRKLDLPC